jgi:LPXTG-motif cell wall-anchored protein
MASLKSILWVERLIWMLVYGGLFTVVIGLATRPNDPATGWSLIVIGGLVAVAGAALVYVRSRMRPDT